MEKISYKGGGSVNKFTAGEDLKCGDLVVTDKNNVIMKYRKPEQKPLIVKSSDTWVAHYNGVDYLCINPETFFDKYPRFFYPEHCKGYPGIIKNKWKPFSEITLTDEIAKLRPMVIDGESVEMLLGVIDDRAYTDEYHNEELSAYELATPHELQELEK